MFASQFNGIYLRRRKKKAFSTQQRSIRFDPARWRAHTDLEAQARAGIQKVFRADREPIRVMVDRIHFLIGLIPHPDPNAFLSFALYGSVIPGGCIFLGA